MEEKKKKEQKQEEVQIKKIFVASSTKSKPFAEQVVGILEEFTDTLNVEVHPWWRNGVFVTGHITLNEVLRAVSECDGGVFVIGKDDCINTNTKTEDNKTAEDKEEDKDDETVYDHIASENVLIEAGMFYGMKKPESVCLFVDQKVPIPSDFAGITHIRYAEKQTYKIKSEFKSWLEQVKGHRGKIVVAENHGVENTYPIFMTNKSQIERELSLKKREFKAKKIRLLNYAGTSFLASQEIANSYDEEWRDWFKTMLLGGDVEVTMILTDPNSYAAVDAALYKMYPPNGSKADRKSIIDLNIDNIKKLYKDNPAIKLNAYLTDIALPYALFETTFKDPGKDHIKVDLYSPLTFNDEKRPSFMVYRENNPVMYEHFSSVIDHIEFSQNIKQVKVGSEMEKDKKDVFLLREQEINEALDKEYRQYFIGNLARPQVLDHLNQGDLEIGTSIYKEAKADKPHKHSKTSEILYILQGNYRVFNITEKKEYVLNRGDFFVLPPDTPYASKAKANTKVLFVKTGGNDKIEISPDEETKKWLDDLE